MPAFCVGVTLLFACDRLISCLFSEMFSHSMHNLSRVQLHCGWLYSTLPLGSVRMSPLVIQLGGLAVFVLDEYDYL